VDRIKVKEFGAVENMFKQNICIKSKKNYSSTPCHLTHTYELVKELSLRSWLIILCLLLLNAAYIALFKAVCHNGPN